MRNAGRVLLVLALIWAGGCDDDCPTCPDDPLPPDPNEGAGGGWLVPQEVATIGEALAVAADGDTVLVAGGTYAEHDLVIAAGVLLLADASAAEAVIIDGGGLGRIMSCSDVDSVVTVSGVTFRGGTDADGAAIKCVSSRLRLVDCVFTGNRADGAGGAIRATDSNLELRNCRFEDNAAESYGGGIYADYVSTVSIDNCYFLRNTAVIGGGGLWANGRVEARGCVFEENDDLAAAMDDDSLISLCTFRGNLGGGLRLVDRCLVENSLFSDNLSYSAGGGVAGGECLTVTGCVFLRNEARRGSGGGIHVYSDSLVVTDCDFIDNVAEGAGGAISAKDAWIESSRFLGNRAEDEGGGIDAVTLDLTDCRLAGNHCPIGAAVACVSGTLTGCAMVANTGEMWTLRTTDAVLLQQCTFAANVVDAGKTILFLGFYADPSRLTSCILAFNEGDLLYVDTPTPALDHCDLFGNSGGDWVDGLADQAGVKGNFSLDPLFCSLIESNVYLCADSPCLPGATGYAEIVGAREHGCVSCGE